MQKLLFLFCETQEKKDYEFVPYKFGGVSFQSYADKRTLTKYGYLKDVKDWELTAKSWDSFGALKTRDRAAIKAVWNTYGGQLGRELVRSVYLLHPYYAIYSEILDQVLTANERMAVETIRPAGGDTVFFTIGYEGITLEGYLNKLIRNNVKLLCDVRKNPLSMKYGFSKGQLKDACNKLGIEYMHFPELGIPSEKRRQLDLQEDYNQLFAEYECTTLHEEQKALCRLYNLLMEYNRVAITCFEACESRCHRGRVATALQRMPGWAAPVRHL